MQLKELRESAERAVSWYTTPNIENAHRVIPDHVFYAGYFACKHILAAVRDDDDEPVNESWWDAAAESSDGLMFLELVQPLVKTRGQFRKLCEGLGITLRESTPCGDTASPPQDVVLRSNHN